MQVTRGPTAAGCSTASSRRQARSVAAAALLRGAQSGAGCCFKEALPHAAASSPQWSSKPLFLQQTRPALGHGASSVVARASSAAERFNNMPKPKEVDDEVDISLLTADEIEERIDEAASFISVMDELRPLEGRQYNPFYEVWQLIARIPPAHRTRLLDELEPGCIRSLWKASMGRFVMDDVRALELFGDRSVWDDLPSQQGQVVEFEGKCERFIIQSDQEGGRLMVDQGMQDAMPRGKPWLRPSPSALELPQERFTQRFFLHPTTGEIHGRMSLRFLGRIERWWVPIYCRLHIELVLTPMQQDAGADLCMVYPTDKSTGVEWHLNNGDLPSPSWPAPDPTGWSPFSQSGKDYMRVIGPGVYVGCGYRVEGKPGDYDETDFVYFVLVRKQ